MLPRERIGTLFPSCMQPPHQGARPVYARSPGAIPLGRASSRQAPRSPPSASSGRSPSIRVRTASPGGPARRSSPPTPAPGGNMAILTEGHPMAPSTRPTIYREVTDRIIGELEQGRVPWVQPWGASGTATPLGLPKNGETGNTNSGINILLLWGAAIADGPAPRPGSPTARRSASAAMSPRERREPPSPDPDLLFGRILLAGLAANIPHCPLGGVSRTQRFLSHLRSLRSRR